MDAQRSDATLEKGLIDATGVWRGESSAEYVTLMPDATRSRVHYLCLQGGGLIERGIWRARRNYQGADYGNQTDRP